MGLSRVKRNETPKMKIASLCFALAVSRTHATRAGGHYALEMAPAVNDGSCTYPANCPNKVLPRADKQVCG